MDSLQARLETLVQTVVDRRELAGVAYSVAVGPDKIDGAGGRTRFDDGGVAVSRTTWFDLASLTKVTATLPLVLRLIDSQVWTLGTRVGDVLPEVGPELRAITIGQLLTHSAGLPSGFPLPPGGIPMPDAIRQAVLTAPLDPTPEGSRYSDVGMFLLGLLVEAVTGTSLWDAAQTMIFGSLGLDFRTRIDPTRESVAATRFCPIRGKILQGEPQNPVTYGWGRLAGHAGLFGQAGTVMAYGQQWLAPSRLLWSEELTRMAVSTRVPGRGLGWMLAGCPQFMAGVPWPADTYGHTGFTGTAVAIIPSRAVVAVLLSNRTHGVSPETSEAVIRQLRTMFFGAVVEFSQHVPGTPEELDVNVGRRENP